MSGSDGEISESAEDQAENDDELYVEYLPGGRVSRATDTSSSPSRPVLNLNALGPMRDAKEHKINMETAMILALDELKERKCKWSQIVDFVFDGLGDFSFGVLEERDPLALEKFVNTENIYSVDSGWHIRPYVAPPPAHRAHNPESEPEPNPDPEPELGDDDDLGDENLFVLERSPLSSLQNRFGEANMQDLDLAPEMVENLTYMGITRATLVQEAAIPHMLNEKDVFIHSSRYIGRTTSYAIAVVSNLAREHTVSSDQSAARVLVIVASKEAVTQTFQIFQDVATAFPWIKIAQLGGSMSMIQERQMFRRGFNILVGTPGAMVYHFRSRYVSAATFKNINCVVVDGLDLIVEQSLTDCLASIMGVLEEGLLFLRRQDYSRLYKPRREDFPRQTIIVAACLTQKVAWFAEMNFVDAVYIRDMEGMAPEVTKMPIIDMTPNPITNNPPFDLNSQLFMLVPERLKLIATIIFVACKSRMMSESKIIIYVGTAVEAEFFSDMFALFCQELTRGACERTRRLLRGSEFFRIDDFTDESDRSMIIVRFDQIENAVLFCTDTAMKDIKQPNVDWIINLSAPKTAAEFMRRIRIADKDPTFTSSLTILSPSEDSYVDYLASKGIETQSLQFRDCLKCLWRYYGDFRNLDNVVKDMQRDVDAVVNRLPWMYDRACLALSCWYDYCCGYPSDTMHFINPAFLHMDMVARCFGLSGDAWDKMNLSNNLISDARRQLTIYTSEMDDGKMSTSTQTPLLFDMKDRLRPSGLPSVPYFYLTPNITAHESSRYEDPDLEATWRPLLPRHRL